MSITDKVNMKRKRVNENVRRFEELSDQSFCALILYFFSVTFLAICHGCVASLLRDCMRNDLVYIAHARPIKELNHPQITNENSDDTKDDDKQIIWT